MFTENIEYFPCIMFRFRLGAGVPNVARLLRGDARATAAAAQPWTRRVVSAAPAAPGGRLRGPSPDATVHRRGSGLRARGDGHDPRRRRHAPGRADKPHRRRLRR